MYKNLFQPAHDTTANQEAPFVPVPDADFRSDELEKSFRGFLTGALDANEQVKAAAGNLASFGYPLELCGNTDVLQVALRSWRTHVVESALSDRRGQPVRESRDSDAKALFEGTGIQQRLPMDPTPTQPVSFTDKMVSAGNERDLGAQKALLEDLIDTVDFDRLATNIKTFQRQTLQQASNIDMADDLDDEPGMSPR